MLYLDASLLAALVLNEPMSARARVWLTGVDDRLSTSLWARTEVASALSINQRTGVLNEASREIAARTFDRLLDEIELVGVERADFRAAERMVARPVPPLRVSDALHLAVASRLGALVHTLDDSQAVAARAHGLDAVVPVALT